ncbi:hypothetical protein J5N97_012327 [Dioscorea zingiberensis]|uniref:NAC domain-containing protein n=1 Tax=Dioscorea zingiberensis TaxID=325984 RepID=A0A9D5CRE4_9LILI|nr:hypothetical protein J5N97_012327 [Dioscorea zingiberensis]
MTLGSSLEWRYIDRSARKKNGLLLDDWVLCRIYEKKEAVEKQTHAHRKPTHMRFNQPKSRMQSPPVTNMLCFDMSDSLPSLSEHVLSPDFTCEREVESRPRWELGWEMAPEVLFNNIDATAGGEWCSPLSPGLRDALQDMFMLF